MAKTPGQSCLQKPALLQVPSTIPPFKKERLRLHACPLSAPTYYRGKTVSPASLPWQSRQKKTILPCNIILRSSMNINIINNSISSSWFHYHKINTGTRPNTAARQTMPKRQPTSYHQTNTAATHQQQQKTRITHPPWEAAEYTGPIQPPSPTPPCFSLVRSRSPASAARRSSEVPLAVAPRSAEK